MYSACRSSMSFFFISLPHQLIDDKNWGIALFMIGSDCHASTLVAEPLSTAHYSSRTPKQQPDLPNPRNRSQQLVRPALVFVAAISSISVQGLCPKKPATWRNHQGKSPNSNPGQPIISKSSQASHSCLHSTQLSVCSNSKRKHVCGDLEGVRLIYDPEH